MSDTHCSQCGNKFHPRHFYDSEKTKPMDTGYASDRDRNRFCFECAAMNELEDMRKTGKADLYLVKNGNRYEVTNWSGILRFSPVTVKRGHHNIARSRMDAWFSFNGHIWHGVNIGEWNQVCHLKQTKETTSRSPLISPKGG